MNKIYTFLIFISISFSGLTQTYISFPDSGATWVNTIAYLEFEPFIHCDDPVATNYCVYGEDTTINDNSYSIVKICEHNSYQGAWRDSSGIVFYVPPGSTHEYLLYDFTVQAGDTIPEVWMGDIYTDVPVYQVDSILIWGIYRKVVHIGDYPWIEGIGCTQGLFRDPWENISGICLELQCMSENDTILYPSENLGSCYLGVGINEYIEPTIDIYPNPSPTGTVIIRFTSELDQLSYKIFNSIGQLIDTGILEEKPLFIGNESGIYYLQIISSSGTVTHRIIIK